jgi:hypothetical protein
MFYPILRDFICELFHNHFIKEPAGFVKKKIYAPFWTPLASFSNNKIRRGEEWANKTPPGRLERPTLCLEGRCSIRLSYGGRFKAVGGSWFMVRGKTLKRLLLRTMNHKLRTDLYRGERI